MIIKPAKAPTAIDGGALGNGHSFPASDHRDIALNTSEIQIIYLRRRARIAPALVPTLADLLWPSEEMR